MANTRILIHQNDETIKSIDQAYNAEKSLIITKANNVIAVFSEFDETYAENGSTTAKYNELLTKGPQYFIDAAVSKITEEFATAGITSPAIIGGPIAETYQKGNGLLKVYDELKQYLNIQPAYPGLKFALNDVEVVQGLASIRTEKDLEPLKDRLARNYIDSDAGHDLVAKAQSLVEILNSINQVLRDNNIYNISELNGFGDFADYKRTAHGSDAELEINLKGIFEYASKIR